MNIEIEPVADIATGAIIAKAIEPSAGGINAPAMATCLNCNTQLDGSFCKNCGQKATIHRSLHAFWHDFTHSIFHFEGKIWRTLPMLFFKPGELTRRYVHGERARFVSPLALFLFSVFLMFASFNQIGLPLGSKSQTTRNGVVLARADIAKEMAISRTKIAGLEAKRAAAVAAKQATGKIEDEIEDERANLSGLQMGYDVSDGIDASDIIKIDAGDLAKRTGVGSNDDATNDLDGNDWSKSFLLKVDKALKNPNLLLYKIQSSAYKYSWLLIPLSLPFLWLMFAWKYEYKLYDHVIFITYSLSFITLLLSLLAIMVSVDDLRLLNGPLLLSVPAVHMFMQFKGAYSLRTRSALWRTVAMLVAAQLVLIVFALILLALGVAG